MRDRCSIVVIVISAVFGLTAASASAQTQLIGHLPGCGGFSLAKFGDWDGDTIPDIVRSCAGAQVLLVSGATGQTLVGLTLPPNSTSHYVHGAIPDVDGDGRPEVVVGDLGGTPAPGPPYYYTAGWIAAYSFLTPSVPLWQRGPSPHPWFALGYRAFATLGDLTGDGIPDIAAGYPGGGPPCPTLFAPVPIFPYVGYLEIVSGADGTLIRSHSSQVGEYWPLAVAAPSDISGDGIADYVSAGAGRPPPGFTSCGSTGPPPIPAYVSRVEAFSGATGSLLWQITGVPMSGILVTAIGDVDGDLDPDILYRANPATGGGSEAIIDATSGSILTQTTGAALILLGGQVGDVNGNGGADFAIGIPGGTVVRTGLAGTSLYTLTGMTAMPIPLWDMNGDGRVEYAFSNDQSAQYPPGYSDWSILSLGSTATPASWAEFHAGCGPGGAVPWLVFSGPPYFGWTRSLGYVNGPPGATGYVFLGAPGPGLGIGGGCTVYLDLAQPFSLAWSAVLDAGGSAFITIVVPQLAGFAGTTVRLQGAHVDAGALALTGALDLLFGF